LSVHRPRLRLLTWFAAVLFFGGLAMVGLPGIPGRHVALTGMAAVGLGVVLAVGVRLARRGRSDR